MTLLMRRWRRDESGAFLILWALLALGLFTMVAIVIDLGQLRETRRQSQLTADLASLAAGRKLAGLPNTSGTFDVSAPGACADAFEYIKSNTRDLPSGASMSGAGGCSNLPSSCTNPDPAASPPVTGTAAADAVATGAAPYEITIRYPIPDSELADPYMSGSRPSDGKPCERMRVTIRRTRQSFFSQVIGVDNLGISGTAVIRGYGEQSPNNIPALALLERVGCSVLETQGASPSSRLIVRPINPNNASIIQTDSYGVPSQGGCDPNASGPEQPTNNIVFGRATTANQPSIETQDCLYNPGDTTCGASGSANTFGQTIINSARVLPAFDVHQVGAASACPGTTCGVRTTVVQGGVVSRTPVDNKYLTQVNALKTSSDTTLNQANNVGNPTGRAGLLDPALGGYKLYPDSYGVGCGAMPAPVPPAVVPAITDEKVLVSETCDLNPTAGVLTFTGKNFIVAGRINVGTGNTLRFPNAEEILVAGCSTTTTDTGPGTTSGCGNNPTGGQANAINIQGNLLVNNRSTTDTSCPSNPTTYPPSVLVLRSGRFTTSTSSVVTLCQVFVYMSGIKPAANTISQSNSASTHSSCVTPAVTVPPTPALPCPINTPNYLGYTEVQGTVTWKAPNQSPTANRDPTQPNQKFEDLALWTEGSEGSAIKGTGSTDTTGLFFLPNATFTFQGQSCTTPRDAQFFARRLFLSGTSCFIMQPLPQNATYTPKATFTLIR